MLSVGGSGEDARIFDSARVHLTLINPKEVKHSVLLSLCLPLNDVFLRRFSQITVLGGEKKKLPLMYKLLVSLKHAGINATCALPKNEKLKAPSSFSFGTFVN